MNKIFIIILGLAGLFNASCTTHIYLVRHAEKESGDNPHLTDSGRLRAIALCDTLRNKGIDSIFSSNFNRTRETAGPTANFLHQSINIYQVDEPSLNTLSASLRALNNKDILVVGHSNTVPYMVNRITGTDVIVNENDFDNMFIITITRFLGTSVRLRQTVYGAPSP